MCLMDHVGFPPTIKALLQEYDADSMVGINSNGSGPKCAWTLNADITRIVAQVAYDDERHMDVVCLAATCKPLLRMLAPVLEKIRRLLYGGPGSQFICITQDSTASQLPKTLPSGLGVPNGLPTRYGGLVSTQMEEVLHRRYNLYPKDGYIPNPCFDNPSRDDRLRGDRPWKLSPCISRESDIALCQGLLKAHFPRDRRDWVLYCWFNDPARVDGSWYMYVRADALVEKY
ncbi:hypothetical protein C8Q73DRAFT_662537 [Cubamyces lactineus]|nr:hypothetical protein C8Q73DRAFT_662537 [Cubamyces lactineus]